MLLIQIVELLFEETLLLVIRWTQVQLGVTEGTSLEVN